MQTVSTQEVPREEWASFCDRFSRRHERWLATVEVFAPEIGAQVEGRSLVFEGVTADLKDGENRIAVTLGETPAAHITHVISSPTHVRLEKSETDRGVSETLQIESADGLTTLVRFLPAVLPGVPEE